MPFLFQDQKVSIEIFLQSGTSQKNLRRFRHEDATMAALSGTIWDFCSSELHLEV